MTGAVGDRLCDCVSQLPDLWTNLHDRAESGKNLWRFDDWHSAGDRSAPGEAGLLDRLCSSRQHYETTNQGPVPKLCAGYVIGTLYEVCVCRDMKCARD